MPFVNEVVTDDDIDAYGLPFRKGRLRYWTHDRAGGRYLWGGISETPMWDDIREGQFRFCDGNTLYVVRLNLGFESKTLKEPPFKREWNSIISMDPEPADRLERTAVVEGLKEALSVYGYDGMENAYAPDRQITFGF